MSDASVDVTLVICTYNRRDSLSQTLDTVAEQRCGVPWEVLIVDNGSDDDTLEMLAERARNFPAELRAERESKRGRSFALNRAIGAARGRILVFTDDDVNLRPGFLEAHAEIYADPAVAGGGGRILPIMPENTPGWLTEMLGERSGGLAGRYDYGGTARDIEPESNMPLPFGANISLRASIARELGGFRTDLGWGKTLIPGEENELFERIRATGARIVYQPKAAVEHRLQPSKVTLDYFLQYEAGYGRSVVLMAEVGPIRRLRWACRSLLDLLRYGARAAFGPRDMSIRAENLRQRARARGSLAQLLGL
jgi:glycosyltransferase involved in cell wall biosynthesis